MENNFPSPSPPPPTSSSEHSYTIIVFVFSTFGCILIGLAILAFWCYLMKKRKSTIIVEEKEVKHIDDHLKIKEAIVEGPHGKLETVVLSVEEDLHEKDDIIMTKKELEEVHHHNLFHANNKSSEITPSSLEAGHRQT
ncbi:unnamed protein product [Withania somnifera]